MNSTAQPNSLKHGWVDSPNGRGTYDIVWTCFFTIFVCTFTVLHLNVPSPHDHYRHILFRKIKWMTFAIVVPEVVTATAFAQYVAARNSVNGMRPIFVQKKAWTKRHAFYWNMSGVWLQLKDSKDRFPINARQQQELIEKEIMDKPDLTSKEIWDKSKADKFAKLLACLQIGWLSTQCVARAIQGLPISLLELGTVGFAIPSLATFGLWFNKPNNIDTPNVVRIDLTLLELLEKLGKDTSYHWNETPLDCVCTVNKPSFVSEVILKSEKWPGRDRYKGAANRIRNDVFALKYSRLDQVFVGAVWLGYGGVHLAAWNFTFPSYPEKILWRVSCLVMGGSMAVFWFTGNRKVYFLFGYLRPSRRAKMKQISDERNKVPTVQIILGAMTGLSYLIARVCLIVQALVSLRALPAGAFETVNWIKMVPHV